MFNGIANVSKHNPRILADLCTKSHNCNKTIQFKIDTGVGGNMLPYDTWKEFFPGQSNADLANTVDRGMTLQAYNKSKICQLAICNLKISHNNCHFFIVHPNTILYLDWVT